MDPAGDSIVALDLLMDELAEGDLPLLEETDDLGEDLRAYLPRAGEIRGLEKTMLGLGGGSRQTADLKSISLRNPTTIFGVQR